MVLPVGLAVHGPAMPEVPDQRHVDRVRVPVVVLEEREFVQQFLARVLVLAVARVDEGRRRKAVAGTVSGGGKNSNLFGPLWRNNKNIRPRTLECSRIRHYVPMLVFFACVVLVAVAHEICTIAPRTGSFIDSASIASTTRAAAVCSRLSRQPSTRRTSTKNGSAGERQRCAKARSTALMCADKFKPLLDEAEAVPLRWTVTETPLRWPFP